MLVKSIFFFVRSGIYAGELSKRKKKIIELGQESRPAEVHTHVPAYSRSLNVSGSHSTSLIKCGANRTVVMQVQCPVQ